MRWLTGDRFTPRRRVSKAKVLAAETRQPARCRSSTYFLHENPELKRAAYCWLTDFVGSLPMPDGDEREASLTADYNAEIVEHVVGFPRLRDRAIFVGNPDDIVPDRLGPELPHIREWTADGGNGWAEDRSVVAAARTRGRGAPLRAQPLPSPGCLRSRGRAEG